MKQTENKNLIEMQSFNKFVAEMADYYESNHAMGSLIQITIKNHDQLSIICNEKEQNTISEYVEATIKNNSFKGKKVRIFEFNKFFYCVIEEDEEAEIREIFMNIHNKLMSDTKFTIFLDVRVVGAKICSGCTIYDSVMILADNIHYTDPNKVFTFIKEPTKYLESIKKDYESLNELRHAINNKSACSAFQPVVKCKTGEIEYHECLLRLNNIDFKLISAGPYIMLAEKYGFITEVDRYVFDMAFRELDAAKDLVLSINISNIGIQDNTLAKFIEKQTEKYGCGKRMIIEVTETAMNNNYEVTKYFIDMIKSCGCKIALDDFGAGHNSFQQIQKLPIDIIKIDGSYIRDIVTNDRHRILVESLIRTSEDLGCKTVAEFVENGPIAKMLIELNVDYMQGNFFSPAVNYRSWYKE